MDKLSFLVSWGGIRKTGWNGTHISLFRALRKFYDVQDIDLKRNKWIDAFKHYVLHIDRLVTARNHRTSYRKKLENLQGKVFQFNDILSDTENRQTYMYVDLTVSFLNSLRKNDQQMFIESGFKCPNPDIMESRAKEQDCYIANSSGLFTMGHWLQDWLIHKGIPSDCVHFAGGGPMLMCH